MKKGYIQLNIFDEKYFIRKDVIQTLLKNHTEETIKYLNRDELSKLVVNILVDKYDDEEYENNIV